MGSHSRQSQGNIFKEQSPSQSLSTTLRMFSLRALVVSIVLSSVFGCVPATSDFSAPDSRQNRQFSEAKQEKLQAVPSPQILPTPSSTPPPPPQTDPAPSASWCVHLTGRGP